MQQWLRFQYTILLAHPFSLNTVGMKLMPTESADATKMNCMDTFIVYPL